MLYEVITSATYFDDKSFDDKRDLYKKTLKSMSELRLQVREDAEETVDYDQYTEDIRALLDKHIAGVEIKEPVITSYSIHYTKLYDISSRRMPVSKAFLAGSRSSLRLRVPMYTPDPSTPRYFPALTIFSYHLR